MLWKYSGVHECIIYKVELRDKKMQRGELEAWGLWVEYDQVKPIDIHNNVGANGL